MHFPYARDIIDEFDFYFDAVANDGKSVDYSSPAKHDLIGWDLFPIVFPSLPEPLDTARQYIELTDMHPGQVVLDLGGYAGVAAMAFMETVGSDGAVISVEADATNYEALQENVRHYQEIRGFAPQILNAAIWSADGAVEYSAESNLGSAVTAVLARTRHGNSTVPALTLSSLVDAYRLDRVDIIKADIEGAEYQAFSDERFFAHHHPTLIFEPAQSAVKTTQLSSLRRLLARFDYQVTTFDQDGSRLPLVVCT